MNAAQSIGFILLILTSNTLTSYHIVGQTKEYVLIHIVLWVGGLGLIMFGRDKK